jgi:hypothetical protein
VRRVLAIASLNEQLAERERVIALRKSRSLKPNANWRRTPKESRQYEKPDSRTAQDLAALSQPQINVVIADLDPDK